MLDDGALALRDRLLAKILVINGHCLVGRVTPVEIDKTSDIKILVEFLKCLLKPGILVDSPAASVASVVISSRFKRCS